MKTTLHLGLTYETKMQLDILLFSEVERRVPKGAYKTYIEGLILRDLAAMRTPCPACSGTGINSTQGTHHD